MRSTESTDSGKDDLHRVFTQITAALSDGDLTFQPPFDLASSAALAANIDTGDIAHRLFEVTQQRQTAYRVCITAVAPGVQDRPIVDTLVAGTELLVTLLDGLIEEYLARQERPEKGEHPGG